MHVTAPGNPERTHNPEGERGWRREGSAATKLHCLSVGGKPPGQQNKLQRELGMDVSFPVGTVSSQERSVLQNEPEVTAM